MHHPWLDSHKKCTSPIISSLNFSFAAPASLYASWGSNLKSLTPLPLTSLAQLSPGFNPRRPQCFWKNSDHCRSLCCTAHAALSHGGSLCDRGSRSSGSKAGSKALTGEFHQKAHQCSLKRACLCITAQWQQQPGWRALHLPKPERRTRHHFPLTEDVAWCWHGRWGSFGLAAARVMSHAAQVVRESAARAEVAGPPGRRPALWHSASEWLVVRDPLPHLRHSCERTSTPGTAKISHEMFRSPACLGSTSILGGALAGLAMGAPAPVPAAPGTGEIRKAGRLP